VAAQSASLTESLTPQPPASMASALGPGRPPRLSPIVHPCCRPDAKMEYRYVSQDSRWTAGISETTRSTTRSTTRLTSTAVAQFPPVSPRGATYTYCLFISIVSSQIPSLQVMVEELRHICYTSLCRFPLLLSTIRCRPNWRKFKI